MAALIASGAIDATSADFTLTGESSTVFLVAAASLIPAAVANVQIKSAAGVYHTIGTLTDTNPAAVLSGPGTYRVSKLAGSTFGVDRV